MGSPVIMMLCSRAPTRISFAGGGTDIPEIASQIGGCVTSVAISRYIYATLEKRRDKKIEMRSIRFDGTETVVTCGSKIQYDGRLDLIKSVVEEFEKGDGFNITVISEVPEHSGLGASASAYAALISLFNAYYNSGITRKEIAEMSYRLEREKLKNKVGKQDQYATCYGGLNFMEFSKKMDVSIMPVKTSPDTLLELEKNLVLLYLSERGQSAGDVIRSQARKFAAGNKSFLKTKELGANARDALEQNDLNAFGKIMALVWKYKRQFSKGTTSTMIENMYGAALKNGAYGGKVSGAGGGGCGFWFCRNGAKNKVAVALENMGAKRLDFKFDFEGVKTWEI